MLAAATTSSHYGVPSQGISSSMPSGSSSPQLSLRSVAVDEEGNTSNSFINLQIFIPELQIQKCLTVCLDELVWDIKRKLFEALSQTLPQSFNFGLFLPPCDGRAGKFLLEDRPIRDYPFHDCVPYVELKYKKRVYKMLKLDEKALKQLHSKSNLKKFMEYVQNRNVEKVEKMCSQGIDPNFHDSQGDTPLTLASGIPNNREILVQLIGGGAHLDFRNSEGQTGMHKASFLSIVESVKTLLELGASPNYRDPIGLTPLYYNMLTTDSNPECAEMLLSEAADICVQDMHANEPLHQACKNGLVRHVEHLLFYGSNINAQNVNGNTPLHVCAVNNRVDCARVLLYRGADLTILNKQAQTAVHVAHIVNNLAVAEVIQNHNPHNTAPFMGVPKYNTRRRMTNNQISRRRSLSHSSMCSMQSDRYQAPAHLVRSQPMNGKSVGISPSPSCSTVCMANGSTGDYGTLKKYPPEYVQAHCGFEANTPRILVIPRGPKGFGFILRGANQSESEVDFEPSPTTPALQFFEGVETTGMAMRAGLRPGDFLLEINGIDVRCASHEQVVHFIHQAEDTITLKVITIEVNVIGLNPNVQQHYAPSSNGKINSASRNSGLPPMVPNRNPVTSLSFGRTTLCGGFTQCEEYNSGGSGPANQSASNEQLRCASVKSRPSAARRISAAELEHLMIRQGTSASQFQPIPYEQESSKNQGPKKFTSVAEMKRRKQRSSNTSINSFVTTPARPESTANTSSQEPADCHNNQHPYPLKSFNSSPDLQARSENGHYSRPFKPVLRPKTPPPPPPPNSTKAKTNGYAASHMPPPQPEIDYEHEPVTSSGAAPPPPPPPPSNLLQKGPRGLQLSTAKPTTVSPSTVNQVENATVSKSDCRGISAEALLNVKLKKVTNAAGPAPVAGSATGTSSCAAAKPATEQGSGTKKPADFDFDLRSALARRRSKVMCAEEEESSGNTSSDDGNKLLNKTGFQTNKAVALTSAAAKEPPVVSNMSRYGGLSLRESVRENVQAPNTKNSSKLQHHSPPGFVTKKDSGYTSSRTSLEPSECGDEPQQQAPGVTTPSNLCSSSSSSTTLVDAAVTTTIHIDEPTDSELLLNSAGAGHRVAILSQQLEDSYGNGERKNLKNSLQETIYSSAATISASNGAIHERKNSASGRPLFFENPMRTPAVDYEEYFPDQTVHSSCPNKTETSTTKFVHKKLAEWNCIDVCDWLADLGLQQYSDSFAKQNISGADLVSCDRARFTHLGVTMIRHRQAMENSLRSYI